MPKEGEAEGGLSEGEVEFIQTRVVVFLKQWFTQGYFYHYFIYCVFCSFCFCPFAEPFSTTITQISNRNL